MEALGILKIVIVVMTLIFIIKGLYMISVYGKLSKLPIFQRTMKILKESEMINEISIDVYGLIEKPEKVSDLRMAIIRPFNWILLNHNYNINKSANTSGVVGLENYCKDKGTTPFIRFNKSTSGYGVDKMRLDCIPMTIDELMNYFTSSKVAKTTLHLPTNHMKRFTDIQAINVLLQKRYFIIDPSTL